MRPRSAPARAAAVLSLLVLAGACDSGAGPAATRSAGATGSSPSPSAAGGSAAHLAVVSERVVDLGGATTGILSLSPDGASFVARTPDGPCIYDSTSLEERACLARDGTPSRIAVGSIAWSPDGRRVAYTEDLMRLLQESDVWVLTVDPGEVRNLTDDGETGPPADASVLDFSPGWSADGSAIIFGRSTWRGSTTEVWSVPADGSSAPSKLGVAVERAAGLYYGTRATERGVYGSIVLGTGDTDLAGVYLLAPGAASATRIVEPPDDLAIGVLQGVTAEGLVLLELVGSAGELAVGLGDPRTGDVTLLGPLQAQRPTVSWAALSPDGTKVAFIRDELGTYSVLVRDLPSGEDNAVYTLDARPAGAPDTGAALFWDAQDRIFVNTQRDAGILLSLGAG